MIARLTGIAGSLRTNPAVVSVHDVGYAVYLPPTTLARLTDGATVTLHIHTHVREDALLLFGFLTEEEKELFDLLLTVPGIGPKTALLVVDRGVRDVTRAVMSADTDFFTAVPRLGRKNAQKIIIELKNKLGGTADPDLTGAHDTDTRQISDALLSMGFDRKEVQNVLRHVPRDGSVEQKIREALRHLGS